ncbi:hypothetical protein ACTNDR_09720, partial [Lactobacillus amylovorus]
IHWNPTLTKKKLKNQFTRKIYLHKLFDSFLKRGWLAAFVTTSYFTNATQQEILEDNYPILLITGKQVAEIVNKELYRKNISLDKYLKSLNMEQEYKNPEDILKEE